MKTKFYFLHFLTILLLLYLIFPYTKAQDSLYLVGTITGESYEKRITNVNRIGDVNADGYDDFMVSRRTGNTTIDQGITQLYLGSATLDLIPNVIFHYPGSDTLNDLGCASEIGDVNDDGYDDFTISGSFGDWGFFKGKAFIYYGGETVNTIPVAEFYEPWIGDLFGGAVEEIGDLNKDGYDDFTISSTYNWTIGRGYVYLFWGGDTISWERSITLTSPNNISGDLFGTSIANIGDINEDGYEDIAISATGLIGYDTCKIYIFSGGSPMDTKYDTTLAAKNVDDEFGKVIKRCGDYNNDAKIDFIIGSGGSREEIILYLNIDSLITFDGWPYIGADGDINKDGFSDFVIGSPNYQNSNNIIIGAAYVYLGKENIDTNYSYVLLGECGSEFASIISFTDINGDEYDEILILAPGYPVYENRTGKIYVYSYKKLTDVKDYKENLLNNFELNQNYPNPFNPTTKIKYTISTSPFNPSPYQEPVPNSIRKEGQREWFVTLTVYDILGREIQTLVNEEQTAGKYEVKFDASKYKLSSGIYFCELKMKGGNSSRIKMVLIK